MFDFEELKQIREFGMLKDEPKMQPIIFDVTVQIANEPYKSKVGDMAKREGEDYFNTYCKCLVNISMLCYKEPTISVKKAVELYFNKS